MEPEFHFLLVMFTASCLHNRNNSFGVFSLIKYSYSLCMYLDIYRYTQTQTYSLDTTVYEDSFQVFSTPTTLESGPHVSVLGHLKKLESS